MTIRDVSPLEAMAVHEFRLAGLQESPEAFGSTFEEESEFSAQQIAERCVADPDDFIVGAFNEEGRLVGMVGLRRHARLKRRHSAQVWGMYLSRDARGQGIGRALLSEVVRRARLLDGVVQISLSVVTTQLEARSLYVGHGFEPYGVEPQAHMQGGKLLDMEHMVLRLG